MKYLYLAACFCAFFNTYVTAQKFSLKNLSVGLHTGATYSIVKSFVSDSFPDLKLPAQKLAVGYYIGARFSYNLNPRWTIAAGADYIILRVRNTVDGLRMLNNDSVIVNATADTRESIYRLNVPVTATYHLLKKSNTPFLIAGAGINIYLGTSLSTNIQQDKDGAVLSNNKSSFRIVQYSRLNIPVIIGAGYKYALTKKCEVIGQGTYNYATGKVMKADANLSVNKKLHFLQLGIALNYRL